MATQLVPDDPNLDVPSVGALLDPVKAQAMQARSKATYRAKRAEAQQNRVHAAKVALKPAVESAQSAMRSQRVDGKTNEELADTIVKKMAKIILLGGEAFVPTSLKECNEVAHTWEMIAHRESMRKGKVKDDIPEDDSTVTQAVKHLQKLSRHLQSVAEGKATG